MRKAGWEVYGREESGEEVYEGFFDQELCDFDEAQECAEQLFKESQRGRFPYKSVVVKNAQDRRKVLYRVPV